MKEQPSQETQPTQGRRSRDSEHMPRGLGEDLDERGIISLWREHMAHLEHFLMELAKSSTQEYIEDEGSSQEV